VASGYTPGLTVSPRTTIVKTRRLPLKGDVLVEAGTVVAPETIVARAELPGIMQTVRAASRLGIDPGDLAPLLVVGVGDAVTRGQVVAKTRGFLGRFFSSEARATTSGQIELISAVSGNIGIRETPTPVTVNAYVPGTVTRVLPGEGVMIETRGALVQGIFGVGGERRAPLAPPIAGCLTDDALTEEHRGHIVVASETVTGAALHRAAELGVVGIVAGGIVDTDLVAYLGYDIGVAITGHEDIPLSLILTEGFGPISMADRTFALLSSLAGRSASICGATQIRAGVIRPEIIVADLVPGTAADAVVEPDFTLRPGVPIRIIREPYFGALATVESLPAALVRVGSGAEVRVLTARLVTTGETVTVPRANVEIVAG
jgi:hypothetical protein